MNTNRLPCFEAAETFGDPLSVSCNIDVQEDFVHETHLLRVHNWRDYVSVHVDYAYPVDMSASTPCLLCNPGGRGRSGSDHVRWLARRHGIAAMSYDWPGRHRSPVLIRTQQDIDPLHSRLLDPRLSYFYTLTNAVSGVYRYWTRRSEGRLQILSGSSWGGVISYLLSAAYDAHVLTYAEFGCGHFERHYPKRSFWDLWIDKVGPTVASSWREMFDPANFLGAITRPVIMATSSNDKFFSLDMFAATWGDMPAAKSVVIAPNTDHSMRDLNPQLHTITKAAGAAQQRDFSFLKTLTDEEALSGRPDVSGQQAWFTIDRARNHIGRRWEPWPVQSADGLHAAQARYIDGKRHLLQPGDRLLSYITYQQAMLGAAFTFSTLPRSIEIDPATLGGKPKSHAPSDATDLLPLRPSPFEDRIPYRVAGKPGDAPEVLQFPVDTEERQVTLTGVLFPPGAVCSDYEIRLTIEILEPLTALRFCLLSRPELAEQQAWGVGIAVSGVRAGQLVEFSSSLAEFKVMNLRSKSASSRRLKANRIDESAPPDLASVTACCFYIGPNAGGAFRVVELGFRNLKPPKFEIENPFSLMTVRSVIDAFAGQAIPTATRASVMAKRLREHEPWRYGMRFSNGVDTAQMRRMPPFVANIHEKLFLPWPWLVKRLKPGFTVLDVGSGIGHHRFTFRALGCGAYTGIEVSRRNADVCETVLELTGGLPPGDRFIYEDAALAEPGERYDLVVCLAVINNVADTDGCLAMMHRALKPGGTLLIETLALETPPEPDLYTPLRPDGYMYDKSLCWIPTLPGLKRSLAEHGFTDVKDKFFWRNAKEIGEGMVKVFTLASR